MGIKYLVDNLGNMYVVDNKFIAVSTDNPVEFVFTDFKNNKYENINLDSSTSSILET